MAKDPYAVLGVAKAASADELKKAYRKLVKQLHPDLHPGDKKAAERFKEVSAAYDIVGDDEKRKKFDRGEIDAEGQPQQPGQQYYSDFANRGGARHYQSRAGFEDLGDISDLFSDMFGAGGKSPGRGRDAHYQLQIDFLTAANGGQTRITLPDGKPLNVAIPEGIADGQTIRLKGLGQPGRNGGPAGDALIDVHVQSHPSFERKGDDVHSELSLSIDEAVLGAKIEVATVRGRLAVTVPKGASSGQLLRLKGRGIKSKSGEIGDHLIRLRIISPKVIDEELETFMKGWREHHAYNPRNDVP
jgi:DnaJ-class molecular chaperone